MCGQDAAASNRFRDPSAHFDNAPSDGRMALTEPGKVSQLIPVGYGGTRAVCGNRAIDGGDPGKTRTSGPKFRKLVLYPAELRGHLEMNTVRSSAGKARLEPSEGFSRPIHGICAPTVPQDGPRPLGRSSIIVIIAF